MSSKGAVSVRGGRCRQVVCERKVRTEPGDIAVLLTSVGGDYVRVSVEARPLPQSFRILGAAGTVCPIAGLSTLCQKQRHGNDPAFQP